MPAKLCPLRFHFPTVRYDGPERRLAMPTGYAIAPKEVLFVPRKVAEKHTNLQRWSILPRGGHFLPAEQPDLIVAEYRAFFRGVRG